MVQYNQTHLIAVQTSAIIPHLHMLKHTPAHAQAVTESVRQ